MSVMAELLMALEYYATSMVRGEVVIEPPSIFLVLPQIDAIFRNTGWLKLAFSMQ